MVLHPHEDLWHKIIDLKKEFAARYDCELAAKSLPHITLVKFIQYEIAEARILQRFRSIAAQLQPFKVELGNFGSFPSHTIYINVTSKTSIVQTVRALRDTQRLLQFDKDNKPHFITTPHITLARKLQPWQYEKAWQEFSQRNFTGRFMANDLLLLKRRMGNKSYYQTVEHMQLCGAQPVALAQPTQGDLFG
ncbi:2'-5' RNA ligase family protein [Deminuibacter soli]|uniref:2'-5' RNA ligase family protein n=2 Tax=Deminuibacter soli TaxID=2291815 RepID=A0A3E1NS71_9BACT|nr:2'-5' RNA ligase family protein [Deminuibacter soli]